jgi:type I restriction enzyme, S subunit
MGNFERNDIMPVVSPPFQVFNIESHWLTLAEKRFDAKFYTKDVVAARVILDKLNERGISINSIGDLSNDLFNRPRFKRNYVPVSRGLPFLPPKEVFVFPLKIRKGIINPPDGLTVEKNWILITCSGTVGRCIISTSAIANCILSHDLIRLIPKTDSNYGYLYIYLNSWLGQAFLTKNQYGATVKHIEPHHVSEIPIPLVPDLEREIHEKVLELQCLREDAQSLFLQAEELLYSELKLPKIDEDNVEYLDGTSGRLVKAFEISSQDLQGRFDASYHSPILEEIKSTFEETGLKIKKLGQLLEDIFVPTRFKRSYVNDPHEGLPFLQGSHIVQIRPMGVKYLWKKMKNIERAQIKKDWLLMTRSGTVGRIGIVSNLLDGWAASEHLFRIIVKNKVNPGYLAAFLMFPYGEIQINGKIYGAVVDEIGEQDTSLIEDIDIICPSKEIQDKIGFLILEAYYKKDKANQIEKETIEYFEGRITQLSEITT